MIFAISDIFLNPGLTGLGILDAFSAGLPFITMSDSLHSPEIYYLKNGFNGYIVKNGMDGYVKTCLNILNNCKLRKVLSKNAIITSNKYCLMNMINKIKRGILHNV